MMKLNERKKKWIIRQINRGVSKTKIALAMNVSRMSIWKFEQKYKKGGVKAFKTDSLVARLNH